MAEVFAFRPSSPKKTYKQAVDEANTERTKHIVISHPDQVKHLPWRGNYGHDAHLHDAVSEYVRNERDPHKGYAAERHANKHGMGEDVPEHPSHEDLEWIKSRYDPDRK